MNILDSKRTETILKIALALALFALVNLLAGRYFFRLDLTEEKRYSITPATKKYLQQLPDLVTVEVYLAGELPAHFKRMQKALLETLDEFNVYSHGKVVYQLIDPAAAGSAKSRAGFMQNLIKKGLQPTDVVLMEEGKRLQKRIFAGVMVNYGSRELAVQLFKGNTAAPPEVRINQSIEGIEYELINAIHQVTRDQRPLVALTTGHREADSVEMVSFKNLLREQYRLRELTPDRLADVHPDVLLLIQPREKFSEADKYYLDQYIMQGGKAIFMLDKVAVNMDSAASGTYTFPYELNLDDLLFRYGVRINNDLVQDFVAGSYPVVIGQAGDQPQIQLLQWPFYPVINNYANHVIVRNLDASLTRFVSSIDTVKARGIRKTILMTSSPYSRISRAPVYVDINILQENLLPEKFDKQHIPVACLLEGSFTSLYKNRFLPDGVDGHGFTEQGKPTALVVIADGDFVKNTTDPRSGAPLPVAFDPFMRQQFANADLVLNAIQYLLEGNGLIAARARQVIIRPLDKVKVDENRQMIRFINLAAPLVLITLLGIGVFVYRNRKYTRF